MNEKLYAKSLMSFDKSYEPQIQMYDHLPYQRDIEVCNFRKPQLYSGNVLKFYQYKLGKTQIIQNDFVIEPDEPDLEEDTAEDEEFLPDEALTNLLVEDSEVTPDEAEIEPIEIPELNEEV